MLDPIPVIIGLVILLIILLIVQRTFFPRKQGFKKSITAGSEPDPPTDRDLTTSINTLANQINSWVYQKA